MIALLKEPVYRTSEQRQVAAIVTGLGLTPAETGEGMAEACRKVYLKTMLTPTEVKAPPPFLRQSSFLEAHVCAARTWRTPSPSSG